MPEHGTTYSYNKLGCRCDDCKAAKRESRPNKPPVSRPPIPHGTRTRYAKYGCRCEECTAANREQVRKYAAAADPEKRRESARRRRKARRKKLLENPSSTVHGTVTGYTVGCRCDGCKTARSEAARKHREANREKISKAKRQQYTANRDQVIARSRQWAIDNPDRTRDRQARWYKADPERQREYRRQHYEANRDKVAEDVQRWRKANPDKRRQQAVKDQAVRRARKLAAFVEDVEPQTVYDRDRWICHICNKPVSRRRKHPDPLSVSLDHVVPLSKGGAHSYENCATAHLRCNLRKNNRVAA